MESSQAKNFDSQLRVRLLTPTDAGAYARLHQKSFGAALGFFVESRALVWTKTEEYYPVVGVFSGDQLVSTMRVEWMLTLDELRVKSEEPVQPGVFEFPLAYLGKAATDPAWAGIGLNSLLRYCAFRIFENWQVHSVLGFMVEGSPRVFTMKEMGYEFFIKQKKWQSAYHSERPVLFAHLNVQHKLSSALYYLEKKIKPLLEKTEFEFQFEDIKMEPRSNLRMKW